MGRTAAKVGSGEKRDAASKLAEHHLSVLELARELGNVAEPCRQRGLDLTGSYEWKRHFQTHGFEGLKDLLPIHKSHPQTTAPETVARIKVSKDAVSRIAKRLDEEVTGWRERPGEHSFPDTGGGSPTLHAAQVTIFCC